jgi:hypothetical protein
MAARIGNSVQNVVIGIVAAVVLLLVGVALGPTVSASIADINATTLADVPMYSVIVLLAGYIPFFYYIGIVLGAMVMIWATVQHNSR